jgi:hypothetical protein
MIVVLKPEYHEGPEARKKFEEGMTKLFKAKKTLAQRDAPRIHQNANRVKTGSLDARRCVDPRC